MRLLTRSAVYFLASACTLLAQHAKDKDAPSAHAAEWAALKSYARNSGPVSASEYLRRGDELKAFRDRNPDAPEVHEAARLEALNVLDAIYQGDQTSGTRADTLAAEVRSDPSLPSDERLEIAALHDYRDFCLKPKKSFQAGMNQREMIARALIKEFPAEPSVYQTLLYLADDAVEPQAQAVARDLLAMPADATTKTGAQRLLDRYDLVGQDVGTLFDDGVLPKVSASKGVAIVYTWSIDSEGSQIGQWLASVAPANATLIGINCDSDPEAARRYATSHLLGGAQVYALAGVAPKLKNVLPRIGNDLVLIADAKGRIRTVSGRVQLTEKLKAATE